ncbi:MAG: nucleoside hydrolase [Nannocystaceae bacterium]
MANTKIPVVWDMETGDPDDFLTLLLLAQHPRVDLRAVTITPGTPDQVGLVREALSWLRCEIPVGVHNLDHGKECVSGWHHRVYGKIPPSRDAVDGGELLLEICDAETTLITGAPLKNLGAAIALGEARGTPFTLGRWFAQGGFAGDGVVPREHQLEKFLGRKEVPTYNLNGAPKQALAALACPGIGRRWFISKNVCHGVYYNEEMHRQIGAVKHRSQSLELIWKGMTEYLRRKPAGKKFHDPLAACCAIEPAIGTWAEVELYRKRGGWGSRLQPGSTTKIITRHNHNLFVEVLTMTADTPA